MIRALRTLCLALGGIGGLIVNAQALPLALEECDRAKAEQAQLEQAGVTRDMSQGAQWARANLTTDRLQRVARWIDLQEQILFRCPRPVPPKPPETAAAPEGAQGTTKAQKPKVQKKVQPSSANATAETGDGGAVPASAVKKKPPAQKKPLVEDAYRPPAPFSGQELQHAAPGVSVPAAGGSSLAPK